MASAGRQNPQQPPNVGPRKFANRNLSSISKAVAARALAGPRGSGLVLRNEKRAPAKGIGIVAAPTPLHTSTVRRDLPRPAALAAPTQRESWRGDDSPSSPNQPNSADSAQGSQPPASSKPAWTKESGDIRAKLASRPPGYRSPVAAQQQPPAPHPQYQRPQYPQRPYPQHDEDTNVPPQHGYAPHRQQDARQLAPAYSSPMARPQPEQRVAPAASAATPSTAPPRTERRPPATSRVIVGEAVGGARWGEMDSDEEEDYLPVRSPAAPVAVAQPPQPSQQYAQPPAPAQTAPPVQSAWRPGSAHQIAPSAQPPARSGYGHQDVRASGRSHEYSSDVGRWSRRSTQDAYGPHSNGYARDDHSYDRMPPSREWHSRSRGMSMDEYPHREHRREVDEEEEQRRALARARAEREELERQRERLRSGESDDIRRYEDSQSERWRSGSRDSYGDGHNDLRRHEDSQSERWRSGSRDSYGDGHREPVQPRRILVNDKPAVPREQAPPAQQVTRQAPSTRTFVDPSRPFASMFAKPASEPDVDQPVKEEQTIAVEQLASDSDLHDRQEHVSRSRQLFDHKSGQMIDAAGRAAGKTANEPSWKRGVHAQPVTIKAADDGERRKRKEEREAKRRLELQQAEERREAAAKEREEEAQLKKEARAKERAERGPRTKGMLFKYAEDGRIVRVLTAKEQEEWELRRQDERERFQQEKAKAKEERMKLREEKMKAREERKNRRQDSVTHAPRQDAEKTNSASEQQQAGVSSRHVDPSVIANPPPAGSGVVVVEAQTGIVHDSSRADSSFEEVKSRRNRQQEKKEERKPSRKSEGGATKDASRKFSAKEQRADEAARTETPSPVQEVEAAAPVAKPKAPAEPAWRGDRPIHEVLGVKPSTPSPEPEEASVQPAAPKSTTSARAERNKQVPAKESKKSKITRPQGVYRPKAAVDAQQPKNSSDEAGESMPAASIKQWKPKSSQRKPARSDSLDHDPTIESTAATAESVAKIATDDNDDEPVLNHGNEPEFVPSGSSLEQQLRDVQGSRGNSPRPEVWRQPSPVGDEVKKSSHPSWQRDHQHHQHGGHHHNQSRGRWNGPMVQPQQSEAAHEAAISTHPLSDLQASIFDAGSWQPTSYGSWSNLDARPEPYGDAHLSSWGNRLSNQGHAGGLPESLGTWSNFALNQSATQPEAQASSGSDGDESGNKKSSKGDKRANARSQDRTEKRSRKQQFKSAEPRPKRLARSHSTPIPQEEQTPAAEMSSATPEATAPHPREQKSPRNRTTGSENVDKEKKAATAQRLPKRSPKKNGDAQRWEPKKAGAPAAAEAKPEAPVAASAPTAAAAPANSQKKAPADQLRSARPKREPQAAAKKSKPAPAPRKRYVVKQPAPDKA